MVLGFFETDLQMRCAVVELLYGLLENFLAVRYKQEASRQYVLEHLRQMCSDVSLTTACGEHAKQLPCTSLIFTEDGIQTLLLVRAQTAHVISLS
jgi:hypothetical protein